MIRFCEFTGDDTHFWDEVGAKKCCPYVGISDICLLHKQPLETFEGWRVCCEKCTTPVQIKDQGV